MAKVISNWSAALCPLTLQLRRSMIITRARLRLQLPRALNVVRAFSSDAEGNQAGVVDAGNGAGPYYNNSMAYSDPSGFETIELFDNEFGRGVGHAAILITSGHGDSGKLYCWCGSKG